MTTRTKFILVFTLTAFGMLGLAFFGIMSLVDPAQLLPAGEKVNDGTVVFAQYMAARNIAVIAMVITVILLKQWKVLGFLLLLNAVTQLIDGLLGIIHQEPLKYIFPLALSALYLLAARFLIKDRTTR